MRTLVDIPDQQIQDLAAVARHNKLSRAEIIRRAIAAYLAENKPKPKLHGFGLWKDRAIDGVEYQQKMRAEWDDR
jgi:metal-responsive CopG/Arc/MetJ family transcriptional regulator